MDKIIGIGSALVDVLVRLRDDALLQTLGLPLGGMTLIDEQRQAEITEIIEDYGPSMATGGSAGNTVLALARLGAEAGFLGKVGRDVMGRYYMDSARQAGIEARLIPCDRHTGVANTFISPSGERTFATCLGAASLLGAEDLTDEMLSGYDILHIEGYLVTSHELIETACRMAKARGMRISLDLASYNVVSADLPFFRHLVAEYVDIVFANEEESAAFTQGKSPEEALREIAGMCQVAVVKLGSRGASAMCNGQMEVVPAHRVEVLDTTAAGDFFAGGFLYALTHGATLQQCLSVGGYLGASVIQVIGTGLSEEQWSEIRLNVERLLR